MELTNNQIEFMRFMEKNVLPNRRNIDYGTLVTAGNLVGIGINTGCRSCAQKGGMDLINMYGQLKNSFDEYNKILPDVNPIIGVEEDIIEPIEAVVKPIVKKKKTV